MAESEGKRGREREDSGSEEIPFYIYSRKEM
jgi:hypothetical protein